MWARKYLLHFKAPPYNLLYAWIWCITYTHDGSNYISTHSLNYMFDVTLISGAWRFIYLFIYFGLLNDTAMLMRSALFWHTTRRRVIIVYRRFFSPLTFDPWRWDRYVVPKCRQTINTRRRIISQKSTDIINDTLSTTTLHSVVCCNEDNNSHELGNIWKEKMVIRLWRHYRLTYSRWVPNMHTTKPINNLPSNIKYL
jgi:hypothetical protein